MVGPWQLWYCREEFAWYCREEFAWYCREVFAWYCQQVFASGQCRLHVHVMWSSVQAGVIQGSILHFLSSSIQLIVSHSSRRRSCIIIID